MHERHSTAMTALVITSIVATGIVVAGLTTPPDEPELTVQPVTTTAERPLPPQQEYVLVTPNVEFPTTIPGCDTVDEPVEAQYSSFITGGDPERYDNPIAPWFNGPKAHLMTEALIAALPAGSEFPDGRIPFFEPIPVYDGSDITVDSTNASAELSVDGRSGYISIGVGYSDAGIPPCVAGDLDERATRPDGTVVDTQTTWREVNGERTYQRSASAYRPDNSRVSAYSTGGSDEDSLPLTLDEMTDVITDPALATSPVPAPGTPGNITDCGSSLMSESSAPITIGDLRSLNTALQEADSGNLVPTPPLGSLHTSRWGGGLCQVVDSAAGTLTITVTDSPDTDPGRYSAGTTVSVPTPSGLGITVTTENPWDPAVLETIARTPGLDVA
nr:hypothetical protein [Rhodococcus sp. (in: high G+C Gram-positive bacteria)]